MVFKCQEDSFLKHFVTKVVSCESATLNWCPTGCTESKEIKGFNIVCEDTILFPESGGQPCDYGTINGNPVRSVKKIGSEAVHFVEMANALEKGAEVEQILDWERRLDHMQQHSGQHLITELFETELKYDTTSWWLGAETSFIELNTKNVISRETLDNIEKMANDIIRQGKVVNIVYVDPENSEIEGVRAFRGLPKDGDVRVIRIEGQRDNLCCGTLVSNLFQIQCVKLLYAEKSKNNIYVHFVVGKRVLKTLGDCYQREQQMTLALKGGPSQHLELIEKLQTNLKASKKVLQKMLKDSAIAEAEKLAKMSRPLPKYYSLHRKDGIEPDFISTFLRNAPKEVTIYFLTVCEPGVGKQPSKGHMVLRGDPEIVKHFGPIFVELLDGKGNGKDGNFQAKVNDCDKVSKCNAMLEEYFKGDSKATV